MDFNKAACISQGISLSVSLLKIWLQSLEHKWDTEAKLQIEEKRLVAKTLELEIAKSKERMKALVVAAKTVDLARELVKEIGKTGTFVIFGYLITKCVRCMRCCPATLS